MEGEGLKEECEEVEEVDSINKVVKVNSSSSHSSSDNNNNFDHLSVLLQEVQEKDQHWCRCERWAGMARPRNLFAVTLTLNRVMKGLQPSWIR